MASVVLPMSNNSHDERKLNSKIKRGAGLVSGILIRVMAVPIGVLVGVVLWAIICMIFFDSIEILPLSALALKLTPGALAGAATAYFYPQVFLWFLETEIH